MDRFEKLLLAFLMTVFTMGLADVLSQRFFPSNVNSGWIYTPIFTNNGVPIQNVDGNGYIITLGCCLLVVLVINLALIKYVYSRKSQIKIVDTKGNFIKYE